MSVRYPLIMKSSDMVVSDYLRKYLFDNVGDHVPDLIRLHAYTFTEYDAVALVDYDTLIVSPVDKVVDPILESSRRKEEEGQGDREYGDSGGGGGGVRDENIDDNNGIGVVFSWEHLPSLVNPQVRVTAINLSFFLIRPSKACPLLGNARVGRTSIPWAVPGMDDYARISDVLL